MRGLKSLLILIVFYFCNAGISYGQWVNQSNPSGTNLLGNFFLNANTGWFCGYSGTIVKTTNGGTSWNNNSNGTSGNLRTMYFLDANTGLAAGDDVYRTTNGGNNWTSLGLAITNWQKLFFIDNTNGWLVGHYGIMKKTSNMGVSWNDVSFPGFHIQDVYFTDANTGWTCGWSGQIYKTTNGGGSWVNQASGTDVLTSIKFLNANTGTIAGSISGYSAGVVYTTTNGGTNWNRVVTDLPGTIDGHVMINTSLFFACSNNANNGSVFYSTNGGTNWTLQHTGLFLTSLNYINSGSFYCGGNSIYKTTNGGFNLSAPTNMTLTAVSNSQINISWTDNSTDEDRFVIERSPDGNSWSAIDSVNAGVTSYQNSGLGSDQIYYYRVCAKKLFFTSGYSNAYWLKTPLIAPSLSSPEAGAIIPYTAVLQWTTAPNAFNYTLQVAMDTNFSIIVYTITAPGITSTLVPQANLQNSTRYYWRVKSASFSNQSLFTPYRSFVFQNPNYGNNIQTGNNLYYFANSTSGAASSPNQPAFNWRDTTGSTNLIVNQTGSPTYGNLDNGSFVINNVFGGNKTKFFGTEYSSVNIGTNGIVSFSLSNFSSAVEPTDAGIPQALATNSIFPFWVDLYYEAPLFPSRLCYKLTANELIITYSKVIMFDNSHISNINNCVSFQVVINHAGSNTINSKIEVLYNYNESGSLFISNYNANTLRQHLIGMQGSNSSAQTACYRFQNSAGTISYSGPIFGSNLALAFAPNTNLLPVELSSFNSQVNGSNVKLNWSTITELNNSGFDIERKSVEENNWKKISFVAGNGTTNQSRTYSFEDKNLASGKYQYRLKQIDYNGNFEYFNLANEVTIGLPNKFSLSQNYPNPFNPITVISFQLPVEGFVSLKVYDMAGKEVMSLLNSNQNAGYHSVEFNGENLSSGTYFYAIQAGDFKAVKKMVLTK